MKFEMWIDSNKEIMNVNVKTKSEILHAIVLTLENFTNLLVRNCFA